MHNYSYNPCFLRHKIKLTFCNVRLIFKGKLQPYLFSLYYEIFVSQSICSSSFFFFSTTYPRITKTYLPHISLSPVIGSVVWISFSDCCRGESKRRGHFWISGVSERWSWWLPWPPSEGLGAGGIVPVGGMHCEPHFCLAYYAPGNGRSALRQLQALLTILHLFSDIRVQTELLTQQW